MTSTDIVVGYDAGHESDLALDWAIAQAKQGDGALKILHVGTPAVSPGFAIGGTIGWETWDPPQDRPVELPGVDRAKAELGDDRVSVDLSIGSPAGRLVDASKDAALVVVGSRGRGYFLSGLLGSTAYAVAAHASCPVAVVRAPDDAERAPRPGPDKPVVVGVDEAEGHRAVLDAAVSAALEARATLVLVRVSPAPPVTEYAFMVGSTTQIDDDIVKADEEMLRRVADELIERNPGLKTKVVHEVGVPGHALAAYGDEAGLIVVGSRGRGGFAGLLLGSTSRTAIHLAGCPVLVLHEAPRGPSD